MAYGRNKGELKNDTERGGIYMKEWYQLTKEEALSRLGVTDQGLTSSQADKIRSEKGKMCWQRASAKARFRYLQSSFAIFW